jgi:hypothetical protein
VHPAPQAQAEGGEVNWPTTFWRSLIDPTMPLSRAEVVLMVVLLGLVVLGIVLAGKK